VVNGMGFDKRYWIFIISAMIFATIASVTTIYLTWLWGKYNMECDSVAVFCFNTFGMIPSMMLGVSALLPVMYYIPFLFKRNERLSVVPSLILMVFVIYTFLDAVNNTAIIFDQYHIYLFAHSTITQANNITGTIVGTGPSLC
jgi:hypothetical protein